MQSSYNSHVKRIVLAIILFGLVGFATKTFLTPDSFGMYGHYRGDAIDDEAAREMRHMGNSSCLPCHGYEAEAHQKGEHATISCEFCHGPNGDHAKDGKKIGVLAVKEGEEIKVLCLRCHNKAIQARPGEMIKTVAMPEHLEQKKVKTTHLCNQCHYVHAPLKYIKRAEEISGVKGGDS